MKGSPPACYLFTVLPQCSDITTPFGIQHCTWLWSSYCDHIGSFTHYFGTSALICCQLIHSSQRSPRICRMWIGSARTPFIALATWAAFASAVKPVCVYRGADKYSYCYSRPSAPSKCADGRYPTIIWLNGHGSFGEGQNLDTRVRTSSRHGTCE